jgi:hypothetical protein
MSCDFSNPAFKDPGPSVVNTRPPSIESGAFSLDRASGLPQERRSRLDPYKRLLPVLRVVKDNHLCKTGTGKPVGNSSMTSSRNRTAPCVPHPCANGEGFRGSGAPGLSRFLVFGTLFFRSLRGSLMKMCSGLSLQGSVRASLVDYDRGALLVFGAFSSVLPVLSSISFLYYQRTGFICI